MMPNKDVGLVLASVNKDKSGGRGITGNNIVDILHLQELLF